MKCLTGSAGSCRSGQGDGEAVFRSGDDDDDDDRTGRVECPALLNGFDQNNIGGGLLSEEFAN
jgi:hypothetical protein